MIRTPTILQIEASECGAACLAIILGYHGRHESMTRLRQACGVSRDGARAAHILSAAREFGLDARAYRCEPEQLRRITQPFVAFWNFNHFVVIEGFGRNKVYVNDPQSGRRTVSCSEFDKSFTGIVLTFEKGLDFKKCGTPFSVLPGLRRRLSGQGAGLLLVSLTTLALVLPSVVAFTLPRVFVDGLVIGGATHWQRPLVLVMTAAALVLGFLTCLQQRALLRVETRLAVKASSRFFWHVLRLPAVFFSQRYAAEIGFRVSSNDRVAALITGDFATNLVNILLTGICFALMLKYDVALTLLCLAIASLNIAVLRLMERRRSDISQLLAQERGNLMGFATGGLLSIDSVKAMGAERDFFSRWAGFHARAANAEQDLQSASQALGIVPPFLAAINTAAVLAVGSLRTMDGVMTAGMLIAFHGLLHSLVTPVNKLISMGGRVQEIGGDLRRLDDVLEHPLDPNLTAQESSDSCQRLIGDIELRNVSFGYSRLDPPLIQDLNLRIPAGSRVAIVGASGSGKSTVAKLLCGLYQPWAGEILFDGQSQNSIPRAMITNSLALVDQEVMLFEGSIADNIALWDNTLGEQALIRAARDAVIHHDIAALPGGYAFQIDEMGKNLSGGQRQRIEIARALAQDPRILVLDEATSALDPLTEKRLADNLRRSGRTCVIIAHRLSTIRDCDEIVVLEKGRIVERGSHRVLVQAQGAYARLLSEQ